MFIAFLLVLLKVLGTFSVLFFIDGVLNGFYDRRYPSPNCIHFSQPIFGKIGNRVFKTFILDFLYNDNFNDSSC